jgi:hypothetical protein
MSRLSSFSKYLRIVCSSSLRLPSALMKPVVAAHHAGEHVEHSVHEVFAHLGGGAEVEHHDARLSLGPALHEEVPRVRVGVEEHVEEQLLVENLHQLRGDVVRIEPHLLELFGPRDLHALHERHREDPARAELVIDLGEQRVRIVGEVGRHALEALGLVHEVGLAAEHVVELIVHAHDLANRHEPPVHLDRPPHYDEVDLDDRLDVRVQHFHGDVVAVVGLGLVHLAERRGGDRLLTELGEQLVGRLAERPRDRVADLLVRPRRHLVLELFELACEHPRQERSHDRQNLPELDEHAAQLDAAVG